MSMPTIPDINPEININRDDAVNMIVASIAMEELALAHILNAQGEKLQYILGTLEGRDPGEVTICDIMEVNKSIHKTLVDVIKAEMLLQFKLDTAVELTENEESCQLTVRGQKIWKDSDNAAGTRPESAEIILTRDGEVYQTATVDASGDGKYVFACLPLWKDSETKYVYKVDEADVPGYIKTVSGYNIINTVEPGSITIECEKTWADSDDVSGERPAQITVYLLQNGVEYLSMPVDSPQVPENTVTFSFDDVPRFDDEGRQFVYSVDESSVANYRKSIEGFSITNTHEINP